MPGPIDKIKTGLQILKGLGQLKKLYDDNKDDPKAAMEKGVGQMKETFSKMASQFGGGKGGGMLENADPAQLQGCANKAGEALSNFQKGKFADAFQSVMGKDGLLSAAKEMVTKAMDGAKAGASANAAPTPQAETPAPSSPTPTADKKDDKKDDKKEA